MSNGIVYLVGAGPGDPGLLTVRGRDILSRADLVLYDGLVNPLLLKHTSGVCERTARTRTTSERVVPQEEINARLINEARAGKRVVRLKGGDPYIFGRGSEEAAALENAGIPYEIVPGITAATAAGEYAGFSFTHRDITSAVAFVTGHEDPTRESSRLDYTALAAFPGTLVFYMGLGRIETICTQLIAEGKSENTPAAVICRASLPLQKTVVSTLRNLASDVDAAGLKPPSLIVVGECVSLRQAASWFENRPLFGVSIGITRPADQCHTVADAVVESSGQPVLMPLITVSPPDQDQRENAGRVLGRLNLFDWLVFTSVNGVRFFFDLLWESGGDVRDLSCIRIAAIGSATAEALSQRSLRADVVPDTFRAEALAEAMLPYVKGKNVLWARASRGRDILPATLETAGATVEELVVYRNEDIEAFDPGVVQLLSTGRPDWVGLSSPSITRQFAQLLATHEIEADSLPTKLASISPVTTEAAKDAGLSIAVEANTYTWDGIIQAISDYCRQSQ